MVGGVGHSLFMEEKQERTKKICIWLCRMCVVELSSSRIPYFSAALFILEEAFSLFGTTV